MNSKFFLKKTKLLRETIFFVVLILIVKVVLNYFGWEFISTSSLLTSIVSGGIFVLGFILSSTHADYKESERIPIEMATSLESIHSDGVLFKKQYSEFDFVNLNNILRNIHSLFRKDLVDHTKNSFFEAKKLSDVYVELEKLGVPANYIVKLKQDQNVVLRSILRVNYVQRIQPIPSAFVLVESIVVGLVVILLFTKMESLFNELISIGFISFIFIYILRLIKVLEMPFHIEGSTMDDVSLFHLEEQEERFNTTP